MIDRYAAETEKMFTIIRKKIAWRGLANSLAETIPTLANAITLCYGGYLVANGEIHFKNVIKCVYHNSAIRSKKNLQVIFLVSQSNIRFF